MKRIMCIWFPNWPIQRRRREQRAADHRPLVLHGLAQRGKTCVVACSHSARRRGVTPGMLLAEAQALCRGCFAPHDPHADREALRQLALGCGAFSPRIAVDAMDSPDCLLLDVTGCGYGFGGEEGLAATAIAAMRARGYWATAAIAGTIGAAWAMVHGTPLGRNETQVTVVPPARNAEALRPLPVSALRLNDGVVDRPHEFDIRQIGQLQDLRRADLPSRFGPELLLRLDQALGIVSELLMPERPVETIAADWAFEPPVGDRQILETVIGRLLETILERLQPRQLGVQRLLCSLELTAHEPLRFPVELLRPSLSLRHLTELARLHVERLVIPTEVSAVALRVDRMAPLEFRQGQMFDGDGGPGRWHEVTALLERLSSRLGEKSVLRPQLRADPQPEFACRYEPWLAETPPPALPRSGEGSQPLLPSPLRGGAGGGVLYQSRPPFLQDRPVTIAVISVVPCGAPVQFHWNDHYHAIAHVWGPERIETGWWRGADVSRDYYLVETTTGERFWLFRSLADQSWFLHGVFG